MSKEDEKKKAKLNIFAAMAAGKKFDPKKAKKYEDETNNSFFKKRALKYKNTGSK